MVLLFSLSSAVYSEGADSYGNLTEWADLFYDPNTGLTAFPLLQSPGGGKYEGMGTAYTAVSSDSGFIEANPAASALLNQTELSFLHNNWIADSNIEEVIYTMRFDNLGMGAGGKFLYVPFTEYNDFGDRTSRGYYFETIISMNVAYNLFSSYYFNGLALGANLKFAYRHLPSDSIPNNVSRQSAVAVMLDIGLLTRLDLLKFYDSREKNFSLGAVLKNVGFHSHDDPLPSEISIGLSYAPVKPLNIAFDCNFPISFNRDAYPAENWNFAVGIDVQIAKFFSMQAGFRNRGSNPRISLGADVDFSMVSFIVNYTLGLDTQFRSLDRFSIEAKIRLGDRGREKKRSKVDELYIAGLEAYASGELNKAIELWEKALDIDPTFQPVKENLNAAKESIRLLEEMEKIQIVE